MKNGVAQKDKGKSLHRPNDPREPLLDKKTSKNDDGLIDEGQLGCGYRFSRMMGYTVSKEHRKIFLEGKTKPTTFPSNKLNNQKYSIISFLPKLLFNEFKFFFNMFFLVIALSQFVPFLKVGLLVTYVAPLIFVLVVTMIKEAFDDI